VECSSVVFQEGVNAHTEEQTELIEFPDNADELHDEIYEMDKKTKSRGINTSPSQQNSNQKTPYPFPLSPANQLNELLGGISSLRCHQRISSRSCWAEYHLSVVTSESAQ